MVAQEASSDGKGTWTLVTAPSSDRLRDGTDALSVGANWDQLDGRIVTYEGSTGKLRTEPVNAFHFQAMAPATFANARLIIANWLSENTMSYALLLAAIGTLLGFATVVLLSKVGRS